MATDKQQDGRHADLRGTAREQLLDAAARVFAERGYRGASVEAIAAEAGVTKGALYWNFENKEDLFFSLLEERVDRRVRLLVEQTETVAGEDTVPPLVSREISDVVDEQRQMLLLTHEYWSLAARDPELSARYAERQRSLRELVAHGIVAHHDATSVALTADPQELATAVIALANGLAMDRIIDPDSVPDSLLGQMLELIYDGLVLRSASAALKPAGKQPVD
jgi:AcrR family transcriptional regulator